VIFHLLARQDWQGAAADAPVAMPGEDGYVHCCDEGQIGGVRQRYFPLDAEIVAVAFDPTRLPAETRYEPGAGGQPGRFPHVYGPLPRDQVAFVRSVRGR
jgi:uncharacterized protein (DUF952 family)